MSVKYGYIRVSTKAQNEDRQLQALLAAGVEKENLFIDKQSGKDFERPAYRKLLETAEAGDLIVVESLDRLGRNYQELLREFRYITDERNIDLLVLDMPLIDTRYTDTSLRRFILDLVLQILSFVAQREREAIRQRQAEGIAAAMARGVKFGRRPKKRPAGYEAMRDRWARGEVTAKEAAAKLGIARSTFSYWAKGDLSK